MKNKTEKIHREGSLEESLLALSGINDQEISTYVKGLDQIQEDFLSWLKGGSKAETLAESLFLYLWKDKQMRFNNNFLLKDVIDSQLNKNPFVPVGNCLGLTSLYTVLGLRNGLNIFIIEKRNHVLNKLYEGEESILVENTERDGFGIRENYLKFQLGMRQEQEFRETSPNGLVALSYASRGVMKMNKGLIEAAIRDLDTAILLDPSYAMAYNNRGNARLMSYDISRAIEDYDAALAVDPECSFAYINRAAAKRISGLLEGALTDSDKAVELDPKNAGAYSNRGNIRFELGDIKGALEDYEIALRIEPDNEVALRNKRLAEAEVKRLQTL